MIRDQKHIHIFILSVVIFSLLGGCSRTQLFYHQLDWLIPRYINHYISLNNQQSNALDQQTEVFLQWHCAKHTGKYAQWFMQLKQDVQNNRIDSNKLELHSSELHSYWLELVDQFVPGLATILYSVNDKQTLELIYNLTEKNQELFEELVELSPSEAEEELVERMEDRFDTWLGSVRKEQLKAIKTWAKITQSRQRIRLLMRERWTNRLHHLLLYRDNEQAFVKNVHMLIRNPEHTWTESYRKQFAQARADTLKLLLYTLNNLSSKQRTHLFKHLDKWARDMRAISCNSKIVTT